MYVCSLISMSIHVPCMHIQPVWTHWQPGSRVLYRKQCFMDWLNHLRYKPEFCFHGLYIYRVSVEQDPRSRAIKIYSVHPQSHAWAEQENPINTIRRSIGKSVQSHAPVQLTVQSQSVHTDTLTLQAHPKSVYIESRGPVRALRQLMGNTDRQNQYTPHSKYRIHTHYHPSCVHA